MSFLFSNFLFILYLLLMVLIMTAMSGPVGFFSCFLFPFLFRENTRINQEAHRKSPDDMAVMSCLHFSKRFDILCLALWPFPYPFFILWKRSVREPKPTKNVTNLFMRSAKDPSKVSNEVSPPITPLIIRYAQIPKERTQRPVIIITTLRQRLAVAFLRALRWWLVSGDGLRSLD